VLAGLKFAADAVVIAENWARTGEFRPDIDTLPGAVTAPKPAEDLQNINELARKGNRDGIEDLLRKTVTIESLLGGRGRKKGTG
jgi:hypothetical protein